MIAGVFLKCSQALAGAFAFQNHFRFTCLWSQFPGKPGPDHLAVVCGRNRPSVCRGVNTRSLPLTLLTAQSYHGAPLRPTSASSGAYTAEAGRNMGRENMSFSVFPSDRTQKDPAHFLLFLFFRFPWKLQTLRMTEGLSNCVEVKATNLV